MKNRLVKLSPRAALFIGAALLSTPAWAQDTTVTPPPVVSTVPAPAPAPAPVVTMAPAAPVVQSVPEPAAEAPARAAPRAVARRPATSTNTTTTRQVTRTTTPAPAAPAPVAEAPAPAPVTAPAPEAAAPAASIEAQTTEVATTETTAPAQSGTQIWPWLLVGALIVAGAVIALLMRRRSEYNEVFEEPYEPVAVAPAPEREPVIERIQPRHEPEVRRPAVAAAAAAPLLADTIDSEPNLDYAEPTADAELHTAEKEDLAGLTANAPVSERPWLEFGMRPIRAGTSADEALVELELTVANAGDLPAKDVRISTFMLTEANGSEMEQMLVERGATPSVPPVTIKPGEGTRVDATLAVRKDTLSEHEFSPVVVADARYTMADGTEGRTSATFRVGLWTDEAKLEPILFDRPEMHREVAAELVGKPAHA